MKQILCSLAVFPLLFFGYDASAQTQLRNTPAPKDVMLSEDSEYEIEADHDFDAVLDDASSTLDAWTEEPAFSESEDDLDILAEEIASDFSEDTDFDTEDAPAEDYTDMVGDFDQYFDNWFDGEWTEELLPSLDDEESLDADAEFAQLIEQANYYDDNTKDAPVFYLSAE